MDTIIDNFNQEIADTSHLKYYLDTYHTEGIPSLYSEDQFLEFTEDIKPIKISLEYDFWYLHYKKFNNKEDKIGYQYDPNIINDYSSMYSFTSYFSKYYNINGTDKFIKIRKLFN